MTREVKELIVDYLRRVPWWAWPVMGAVHGQMTWFYLVSVNSGLRNIGALGSYMLVALLQNRAWLRVVSSLPLARRDIWRAQWWIGIGGPGLILTGLDCLIVLGVQMVTHLKVDLWHIALWMTNTWAALGLLLSLTGSLFGISERFRWTPIIILPVYTYVLANGWPTDGPGLAATLVVVVIGLAGAIVSYVWPALLAPVSPAKGAAPAQVSVMPASNQSGWAVLAAMHGRYTLVFAGLLGAGVVAMRLAWEGTFPGHSLIGLVFVPSAIASFMPWTALPTSAARTFRSLPLSTRRLTAIAELGGLVPAAFLLLGGLAAGGMSASELWSLLPAVLTVLALQTLIVPIRLRMGEIKGMIVVAVFFMLPVVISAVVMTGTMMLPEEPWWLAPVFGWLNAGFVLSVTIAAIGILWTRYELGAGGNAYLPASPSPLVPASFSGGPGTLPA